MEAVNTVQLPLKLKIKRRKMAIELKLNEGIELPTYGSDGASGFDVTVDNIKKAYKGNVEVVGDKLEKMKEGFIERGFIKMRPFERILFGTGITPSNIPEKIELQARDRSGVALKRGLLVANSPGTIDNDYRGEIGVIIINATPFLNEVERGERLAQIVPAKVEKQPLVAALDVTTTDRGEAGFGSTGTK